MNRESEKPCARTMPTEKGHVKVSNREIVPWQSKGEEAVRTGHVWVEVKSGMSVHRFMLTPSEAMELSGKLADVARTLPGAELGVWP